MVTVTGYRVLQNKDKENFIVLDVIGSLELVQSQGTGKFYATVRKCSIPSTFDEKMARMMVGNKVKGEIVRVACTPYDYTIKKTGEVIKLAYSWAYQPEESASLVGETQISELVG